MSAAPAEFAEEIEILRRNVARLRQAQRWLLIKLRLIQGVAVIVALGTHVAPFAAVLYYACPIWQACLAWVQGAALLWTLRQHHRELVVRWYMTFQVLDQFSAQLRALEEERGS